MNAALPYHDSQLICYALAAVIIPFAAFLINFCLSEKAGGKISGIISSIAILASAGLSIAVFSRVWNVKELHVRQLWFVIGDTRVYAGLLLNNLSVLLLLLVTLIALPVHIYSTAYMKQSEHQRYFSYLSFFCFSMLALALADNLVMFYAFWELVGFSSYLLIGFWYRRDKAVSANKKAFVMNRIGDAGLLIAVAILFAQYHTFDIKELFGAGGLLSQSVIKSGLWAGPAGQMPQFWQYAACAGILLGMAAKSAQFPLHTWLPDAMEGPTSVSALIHAATMVAAGVFLLGRVYPLFNAEELDALAIMGCFTAFMAATIALTQNDLKRILAYSTISQLGYMVAAMGIHAYASSLFHLVTHAFFKCLLFLCSGMIIHQLQHIKEDYQLDADPQDIRNMGGLRKKLPLTFIACVAAGLALAGLPLTSGYLSKDGILIQAFEWSRGKSGWFKIIPYSLIVTSALTAFYIARLVFKVFFGSSRLQNLLPDAHFHINDGDWRYKAPLILLTICCLFPWFSQHPLLYEQSWLFKGFTRTDYTVQESSYQLIIPAMVTLLSLLLIYGAYRAYGRPGKPVFPQSGFLYNLSYHEWYIDRFYQHAVVKAVVLLSRTLFWIDRTVIDGLINVTVRFFRLLSGLAAWADRYIVDGFLNLMVLTVQGIGDFFRRFQGGRVQVYIYSMLLIIAALFIFKILI